MTSQLTILLRHGPYGRIQAAEALRHAGGALGKGWEVALILLGDGVYTGLPYQYSPDGTWIDLSETMRALLDESDGRMKLCVDERSLEERGLTGSSLYRECHVGTMAEIAALLTESGRVLIF